ncbi:MAG: type II toxin-antitoxin system Phd/YefM family antitoxin [Candidatus Dormibacteria bacterium]
MRQVPIRELNQHTADVLARVERGERVAITRNGTRVAIIEPAEPNPLSGLIESGDLRPGLAPLPLFSDSEVSEGADSVGLEAILEDRYGTARW